MMDRRTFLRRSALIAGGIIAADQLDVLEMLDPRRLFAGFSSSASQPLGEVRLSAGVTLIEPAAETGIFVLEKVGSRSAYGATYEYFFRKASGRVLS